MNISKFKQLIICCLCLILCNIVAQAAHSDSAETIPPSTINSGKFGLRKMYFGGGIGGHVSNNSLYFNVFPQIGYRLVDTKIFDFVPGVSFTYQYYQATDGFLKTSPDNYSTNVYGPGVFARFYLKNFFAHAEYQYLWYQTPEWLPNGSYKNVKANDDFLLVGVGVKFPVGRRSGISVSVLFDVLQHQDDYKIYDNPVVNIGFSF